MSRSIVDTLTRGLAAGSPAGGLRLLVRLNGRRFANRHAVQRAGRAGARAIDGAQDLRSGGAERLDEENDTDDNATDFDAGRARWCLAGASRAANRPPGRGSNPLNIGQAIPGLWQCSPSS